MINYISYGGGVQSTAMVLMAIDGKIARPDMVVFSDTGSEMGETYDTVKEIKKLCLENDLPFYTTFAIDLESGKQKKLHEHYMKKTTLPMVGVRHCTSKFKIDPVRKFVKQFVDKSKPKPWMNAWLGITADEKRRATGISYVKYQTISYPLLEISREQCFRYIKENYPELKVSKSGCFCCPYGNKNHWNRVKKKYPDLFSIAKEMEKIAKEHGVTRGLYGTKSISIFDYSHQLTDFGFVIEENKENIGCSEWGCMT